MTSSRRPLGYALIDRWIARSAVPHPDARAAVARLCPAVVVTGGSSGIGLAIARRFVTHGASVVLVARTQAGLSAACATLAPHPNGRLSTLALDIAAPTAAIEIDAALAARGLYLDILVNAAGVGLAGPFEAHDPDAIDRLLALNVAALTRLTRHALPAMKARARGGVLNVASLGGYVPGPNQAAYYASKAYVCSLTEAVAAELAGSGVRMTVLAPGPVATPFHANMGADGALYRWLIPAISPDRAAAAAHVGYELGRTVVVPGLLPRVMAVCVSLLPHWVTVPLVRRLLAVG